jgi:hypothetical protein
MEINVDGKWMYFDPTQTYFYTEESLVGRRSFKELLSLGLIDTVNKYDYSQLFDFYYTPAGFNFFYKLELFNNTCLFLWHVLVPIILVAFLHWSFLSNRTNPKKSKVD